MLARMTKARAALFLLVAFDSTLHEPFRAALALMLLDGMQESNLAAVHKSIVGAWSKFPSHTILASWRANNPPPVILHDAFCMARAREAMAESEHGSFQWYLLVELMSGRTTFESWTVLCDVAWRLSRKDTAA